MFLESLNLAAVWNLPAIFIVENNGYAESTSRDYATAVDSYVDRAAGFGLPGVTVDGTDFFAVYEAAGEIIKRAREGGGPSLLECKMIRFYGHFEGDQQTYRAKDEVENLRASKDCIKLYAARVIDARVVKKADLDKIDGEVGKLIERARRDLRTADVELAQLRPGGQGAERSVGDVRLRQVQLRQPAERGEFGDARIVNLRAAEIEIDKL